MLKKATMPINSQACYVTPPLQKKTFKKQKKIFLKTCLKIFLRGITYMKLNRRCRDHSKSNFRRRKNAKNSKNAQEEK